MENSIVFQSPKLYSEDVVIKIIWFNLRRDDNDITVTRTKRNSARAYFFVHKRSIETHEPVLYCLKTELVIIAEADLLKKLLEGN